MNEAASRAIATRLRDCLERGELDALADAYAADALLDASLPGERIRLRGGERIAARPRDCFPGPGRLVEWSPDPQPAGIALWLERLGEDGAAVRQRHYLHVGDGLITRHWIYAAPPRTGAPATAASDPLPGALARLGPVVEREPLSSSGWSGNRLERVRLADGRRLIAKRIVPKADWIGRATSDPGREALLVRDGALARMPAAVDHTLLAAEAEDGAWWVISREVSEHLIGAAGPLSRERGRLTLQAANAMWESYWGHAVPHLASLHDRLHLQSPTTAERERSGLDLLPKQFEAAWEAFTEAADPDLAEAVIALANEPAPLAIALEERGTTLIDGDLRDEHIGFAGGRLILLDWGLATRGHPAVEFAWYMCHTAWRIRATRNEIVDDFRAARGDAHDEAALRLGLLAGLVLYGWIFGHSAVIHPDPAEQRWAQEELAWWMPQARRSLEAWSPSSSTPSVESA